mgnify:CR=1 FL=1
MRIGNNPVGNYSPIRQNNSVNAVKAKQTSSSSEIINSKEKEFFSKLYPTDKSKIMQHHFYMKNGNMSGVMVGSLIDRRG